MNEQAPSSAPGTLAFPLFEGGPFHRLLERVRLVQEGRSLIVRRIVLIVLITWTPLVMLALVQGFALGPTRLESFLMDFAANVRFLVTVPALILAEGMCGARVVATVQQLLSAGLIEESCRLEFETNVRDSVRLSRSGTAEAILLALAYLHSAVVLVALLTYPVATWQDIVRFRWPGGGTSSQRSRSIPFYWLDGCGAWVSGGGCSGRHRASTYI